MLNHPNDQLLDDTNLIRDIFAIQAPKSFSTLQEQLSYALSDISDIDMNQIDNQVKSSIQSDPELAELLGISGESPIPPEFLKQHKFRDTSLGGNDAINCYPQFHEDDDLVHPYSSIDSGGNMGLGRAYNEKIDSNQQILWMTFGVPRFTNIAKFYSTAVDTRLAKLMNTGDSWNAFSVGYTIGTVIGFVATIPLKPFEYMASMIEKLFDPHYASTRYYDLKPAMPLYYRIVNVQLAILACNMQLSEPDKYLDEDTSNWDSIFDLDHYSDQNENIYNQLNAIIDSDEATTDIFDTNIDTPTKNHESSNVNSVNDNGSINNKQTNIGRSDNAKGLPKLFSRYGLDIIHILAKKDLFDKRADVSSMKYLDEYLKELRQYQGNSNNFWKEIVSGFLSGTYESLAFVGFKIEKSTDSSESLSNTTALPDVASSVNSKVQSVRSMKQNVANFNLVGGVVGDTINGIFNSLEGFITGALDEVGLSGIAGLLTGQGLVDFQELWQDSSFSKSYSFNVKLRAISGDRVSLFYKYVILIMLLAGSLPRSTGRNSYTSPFIVRAYSKGMFAIPLGIIDSISIKRGSSEFGWSVDKLPLSIDISFTIKDLSPVMFMSMADNKSFSDILGQNTSFDEYLMTLAGSTLQDRLLFSKRIKRSLKILHKLAYTNKLNPMMWGFNMTNNFIGNIAIGLSPISKLPK